MSGVFLSHPPRIYLFRDGVSHCTWSIDGFGGLASEFQGYTCFYLVSAVIADWTSMPFFSVNSGNLNSGPLA